MRHTVAVVSVVLAGAVGGLAGCSNATNPGVSTVQPGGPNDPASASASPSHPISFYADQYTKIDKDCQNAASTLHSLGDSASDSATSAAFSTYAKACQARDNALLRAQWPADVLPDIKSYVHDDGPLLTDAGLIGDGNLTGLSNISSDIGAATAAENVVLADLHLPPDNPGSSPSK